MPDLSPGDGNAHELKTYWTKGKGAALIAWGTPGDFTRCTVLLGRYMSNADTKGYCANLHHDATGMWPGDSRNT